MASKTQREFFSTRSVAYKLQCRREHLRRLSLKRRKGVATAKAKAARPRLQFRLQRSQYKSRPRTLGSKALRRLLRARDRRKRFKRRRLVKRPSLPKEARQIALARQLIRKLRAISRSATRALRHRLLRHKRRYFRKQRMYFNVIRYTRRLRVKRRAVRRARRYLRSTVTVLRGARARILNRRAIARKQRTIYLQVNQRSRTLLLNPTTVVKQAQRQQLFIRKEQRRRMRALCFLTNRALTTAQAVKAKS